MCCRFDGKFRDWKSRKSFPNTFEALCETSKLQKSFLKKFFLISIKWEPVAQSLGLPPNLWLCSNFRPVLVVFYKKNPLRNRVTLFLFNVRNNSKKNRLNSTLDTVSILHRKRVNSLDNTRSWRDAMSWMANPEDRWKDLRPLRKLAKISMEGTAPNFVKKHVRLFRWLNMAFFKGVYRCFCNFFCNYLHEYAIWVFEVMIFWVVLLRFWFYNPSTIAWYLT